MCIRDSNKDIDKDLIGPEYLPAWEKFGLFGLKCKNTEETIRAYSMADVYKRQMQAMASDFDAPTEKMESIVTLLYQSGYLTIKGYDEE